MSLEMPRSAGHLHVLVGGMVWLAVLIGLRVWAPLVIPATVVSLLAGVWITRYLDPWATIVIGGMLVFAVILGWGERAEEAAILASHVEEGETTEVVTLHTAPRQGKYGHWALASIGEGRRLLRFGPLSDSAGTEPDGFLAAIAPGDLLRVQGMRHGDGGLLMGHAFKGVIRVEDFVVVSRSRLHSLAMTIREKVLSEIRPEMSPSRALLAGFLIGATDDLPDDEEDRLRRSGLSHFIAVSGSNVAMFLGLVFLIAGPLGWTPRRRAVMGLAAIVLFVVVTRFEPSVIRAGTMAGVVLGGRLVGIPMDGFGALGAAVAGSVLVAPALGDDVGFALSALATAGVLAAAELSHTKGWGRLRTAMGITLGAQFSVAPLLVLVFGSVPAAAPVANLIAAPLVASATMVATVGVLTGLGFIVSVASVLADGVLMIADVTSDIVQLGPITVMVVIVLGAIWWRLPRWRLVVPVSLVVASVVLVITSRPISGPVMVALDVGQGDAILVVGAQGETLLVDGGPDGEVVLERLRAHGIGSVDLVVASHVHADHVTGLSSVVRSMEVGAIWLPTPPHSTPAYEQFQDAVLASGVAHFQPPVGDVVRLGSMTIEVVGPKRRYASPNDQSVVLWVDAGTRELLLTGDVEVTAQEELAGLSADIIKVPHQGAATSDPDWLRSIGADVAVVSVGPNDFGHPSPEVIEVLEDSGASVHRTDLEGDVVIPLG